MVALALLAGCGQPPPSPPEGLHADLDAAMADLAGRRDADARWPAALVPYILEAASAAGLDVHEWPAPLPVADQVGWPPANGSFLSSLRPLHAAALAADGDAQRLSEVRERTLAGFDGSQFGDPALLNDDAFALVVLGAAGAEPATWAQVGPAVRHLVDNQSATGGWPWAVGGAAETDMTGLVLHGLAQADAVRLADAEAALAFLATTRGADGGHSLRPGGEPNCDSTVWAIRSQADLGLAAPDEAWRFLAGLQTAGGGFAVTPGGPPNDLCTAEAATLLGLSLHGRLPPSSSPAN